MRRRPKKPLVQELAQKLLDEINAKKDAVSCLFFRRQIDEAVRLERAGVVLDDLPEYRSLLQHFDRCAGCLNSYLAKSEDANRDGGAGGGAA